IRAGFEVRLGHLRRGNQIAFVTNVHVGRRRIVGQTAIDVEANGKAATVAVFTSRDSLREVICEVEAVAVSGIARAAAQSHIPGSGNGTYLRAVVQVADDEGTRLTIHGIRYMEHTGIPNATV